MLIFGLAMVTRMVVTVSDCNGGIQDGNGDDGTKKIEVLVIMGVMMGDGE